MGFRQFMPSAFLTVLSGAVISAGTIGACGATGFLWWMNQEVVTRFAGLLHVTDALPFGYAEVAVLLLLAAAGLAVFARRERVAFMANYTVLVALSYAILYNWVNGGSSAPNAPDWPLMLGLIVALAATISCYRQLSNEPAGLPAAV